MTPQEAPSIPDDLNSIAEEVAEDTRATRSDYIAALKKFDAAICEAVAVSQAASGRFVEANKSYATRLFVRLCAHGIALVRAVPLTRWVKSDHEDWDFSCAAPHVRAILEGYLLFSYIIETPKSPEELSAKINIMHLNDCMRRVKLFTNLESHDEIASLVAQADELRERLLKNEFFLSMPEPKRKRFLAGEYLMIDSRDERLNKLGIAPRTFSVLWDLLSQNTHVLPLSFYRLEPNGRGTGLENATDRNYLTRFLTIAAETMEEATNLMVGAFPDATDVRKGVKSGFSPGPRSNEMAKQAAQRKKNR
ncbi:hypothetical protein R75461_07677 [Paraburkholderia nemoris]|uniref:DUF5677 domain-containing protein n=1 Tax=Paraburkholderia nemoris TaxID=2793076 RepID=UPI00190A7464|nr:MULTISPECIES: DUF5677 domain-containing protein [Paraburkholderia]MBK3786439.1 hypothetical protein [Paraburkholderia aspalathi]CAE6855316.1 hypothetical protein R75461_07677 [Paraburkholderia nemoris]